MYDLSVSQGQIPSRVLPRRSTGNPDPHVPSFDDLAAGSRHRRVVPATVGDVDDIARRTGDLLRNSKCKPIPTDSVHGGVRTVLEAAGTYGRYFVIRQGAASVGQLLVQPVFTPALGGFVWWVDDVYIDPPYRRNGCLSAAFRHVENLAQSAPDAIGLRLQVDRDNHVAQRAYEACGMKDSGRIVMQRFW